MSLPEYAIAIRSALATGYRVDPDAGVIYGLKGRPLTVKRRGSQRYPTVPLVVQGMRKRFYAVPAHKVMAFALWGEDAFTPGIHVMHGRAGVENIAARNLRLGTAKENEADKSPELRSAVGRIARAHQDGLNNAKLTAAQVAQLRAEHAELKHQHRDKNKLPNGTLQALCTKYNISKTNIADIVKGRTWTK